MVYKPAPLPHFQGKPSYTHSRLRSQFRKSGVQEARLLYFPGATPQNWSLGTINFHSSFAIARKFPEAHSALDMRGKPQRKEDLVPKGPCLQTIVSSRTALAGPLSMPLLATLGSESPRQTQLCSRSSLVWFLLETCAWKFLTEYFLNWDLIYRP